ncbi:SCO3374 family protein [Streptomyces sp. NPDC049555]|uniref:SCO3374 family protein n=1 Tax=Streptomyces sp. NPDC049555 TaxID=3154930 RepID=UPI00342EC92E
MTVVLPRPCRPLDEPPPAGAGPGHWRRRRQWYECVLGWPTAPTAAGRPVELLTGVRFDALGMPAEAGVAVLARVPATGPVALDGRAGRMWFLTAPGSAEELPGLLTWLEWSGVALELTALGRGGRIPAPAPVGAAGPGCAPDGGAAAHGAVGGPGRAVEAVWARPPEPGCEVETTLPVTGLGDGAGAPDLVRLVGAAATECHRTRLLRAAAARSDRPPDGADGQPLAFSYASRMSAGTRPRSLTL